MVANEEKGLHLFEFLITSFFAMYYLLNSVESRINFVIVLLLAWIYIGYLLVNDYELHEYLKSFAICCFVIAFSVMILTDSRTISQNAGNLEFKQFFSALSQYTFMFLPVVLLSRIIRLASEKQIKYLIYFFVILYAYVAIITFKELIIHPGLIHSWQELDIEVSDNIASYYFVYAIPLIITLLFLIMNGKTVMQKFIIICIIAFLFYFVFLAEYTLAILITAIGLMVALSMNLNDNKVLKIFYLMIIIFILIFMPNILEFLATHIKSHSISLRLMELREFFVSNSAEDTYNLRGRLNLYLESFKAFLHSPIIGNRRLSFDGHALFLTILADVGLVGGIPFFYLLFSSIKKVKFYLGERKSDINPPLMCLIITGFTNPLQKSYPVSLAMWLLIPLIILYFSRNGGIISNERMEN